MAVASSNLLSRLLNTSARLAAPCCWRQGAVEVQEDTFLCRKSSWKCNVQVEPPARAPSVAPTVQQTRLGQRNEQYGGSTQPSNGA